MPEVILPCPFCGMKYNEKAVMLVLEPCDTDGYFVQCLDCGASGPVGYPEEYDHYDSDAVEKAEEEAKAKALDLWANIKPRALRWTHEPPKVAGWYWMRQQGESFDLIQHYNQADIDGGFDNERQLKQWAGPIALPVE
ncbi:Lar family restriction alleviation protein [Desulfovibrio desulfuricans]|uniref:Lar family restriction alleviation protein n=1 Tax=Desulfovibrio desulfuricans TaxID=876 RepID=UPI001D090B22|nr:Lar family restriction alleviation protein [Desulfovibrio desulfuricans]MCB6543318.1 Lar family restriction alleviation protein [Desulfovibrio desulfuricans]MCB6554406.1 Lar family restriction alleviation protein [Desulfovibrio desulfuricans]MCB6566257.1 Lar family restriction alleviation protein [Desulfovibrio desulfuricans]MCB7347407.1 Lar family restriction alleviation protein [Desulfovibrio desulfuricans]MCQ5219385.1 Lar family restriction alleviation protein [Desulfovibrio desulfurican